VAIARALVKEPAVLLADGPTGNLDEETRGDIIALLDREWRERGLTMVIVTHDSFVAARATRTALMRDGQLTLSPTGMTPTSPDVRGLRPGTDAAG
jgi:putative ABC transport system ATP-binding protein